MLGLHKGFLSFGTSKKSATSFGDTSRLLLSLENAGELYYILLQISQCYFLHISTAKFDWFTSTWVPTDSPLITFLGYP